MEKTISPSDRIIIREVAKKQSYYAQSQEMQQLKKDWYKHNSCSLDRPLISVELWTFYGDVVPKLLQCEGEYARQIEGGLYSNFVNHTLFKDDWVVPDYFGVSIPTWFTPFGIEVKTDTLKGSIGHHFKEVLTDLGDDFHLLRPSEFGIDREQGEKNKDFFNDLLGDILPVKYKGGCLGSSPTQSVVHIMSLENMLFSLYDYPDKFKTMMQMIADDTERYFRFLENEKIILPTAECEGVAQGSLAFTNELPGYDELAKRPFTIKDVWGYMDSQETSDVSPALFEEMIFPCYKQISQNYGMLSYGCCEGVDPIWENCLSKLTNLRKISISPWCREEYMGEQLANTNIIYQRKPSPNFLGVGSVLDEEGLRAHIRKTLAAAKDCTLEFTQRDVYQLHNSYEKVARYVQIIREVCAE